MHELMCPCIDFFYLLCLISFRRESGTSVLATASGMYTVHHPASMSRVVNVLSSPYKKKQAF